MKHTYYFRKTLVKTIPNLSKSKKFRLSKKAAVISNFWLNYRLSDFHAYSDIRSTKGDIRGGGIRGAWEKSLEFDR